MIIKFSKKGFTIVELIVVISVFSIIAATTFSTLGYFLNKSQLNTNTDQIIQNIRKAQSNSMMKIKDSQWGFCLSEDLNTYKFFKGSTCESSDAAYDDIYELPDSLYFDNISLAGGSGTEVVFTKINGETPNYGSFEVKSDNNDSLYIITINYLGQVEVD